MKSNPSERQPRAPLDWRVPTTAADVDALRRLREQIRAWPLDALNQLNPPGWLPVRPSRKTSAGAEPFRL